MLTNPDDIFRGALSLSDMPHRGARLGKATLTARQLSARGGDLACRLSGDRVFMSGSTVEYMRGEIDVAMWGR
jgi:hypothetical protein